MLCCDGTKRGDRLRLVRSGHAPWLGENLPIRLAVPENALGPCRGPLDRGMALHFSRIASATVARS